MRESNSVLVVAAHPDDEVIGCGGTISRLAREGRQVTIAILGEGITSRYSSRESADRAVVDALRCASREAGRLLGADEVILHDLPDNRFDSVPLLDIVKVVEGLLGQFQPRVVYTHHAGDLNIDHELTYRAVLTATRPLAGCPVKELYTYEVASSTEWAFQTLEPAFRPNTFVDVSAHMETKLAAMRLYESEAREFPHPRSREALLAIAKRWGSVSGLPAAEAFQLVRAVR